MTWNAFMQATESGDQSGPVLKTLTTKVTKEFKTMDWHVIALDTKLTAFASQFFTVIS